MIDNTYLFSSILESCRKRFDLQTDLHLILLPYFLYPLHSMAMTGRLRLRLVFVIRHLTPNTWAIRQPLAYLVKMEYGWNLWLKVWFIIYFLKIPPCAHHIIFTTEFVFFLSKLLLSMSREEFQKKIKNSRPHFTIIFIILNKLKFSWFDPFLRVGQKNGKNFVVFLEYGKPWKIAYEIKWPLKKPLKKLKHCKSLLFHTWISWL